MGLAFPSSLRNHEMGVAHTVVLISTVGDFLLVECTVDCRLGYGLDGPVFESLRGQEIVLFSKISRPAVGTTQPPLQWVSGFFPGVKVART